MGCASTLSKVKYISELRKNLGDRAIKNSQQLKIRNLLDSFRDKLTVEFNQIGYKMDVDRANNNNAEFTNDHLPVPDPDRPTIRTSRSAVYERSVHSQRRSSTPQKTSFERQEPQNPSRENSTFSIRTDNPPVRRPRSSSRGRNCRVGFGGRWDDNSNVFNPDNTKHMPSSRNATTNRQVSQSPSRTVSFQSTYTGNSDYGTGGLDFSRNETSGIADITDFSREHTFLR